MAISPKAAAEIKRLMQTPGTMRAEADEMRRSVGRSHYDPTQPRVPGPAIRTAANGRLADIVVEILIAMRALLGLPLMRRNSLSLVRGDQEAVKGCGWLGPICLHIRSPKTTLADNATYRTTTPMTLRFCIRKESVPLAADKR